MGKSRKSKRGGGKHLGKLVPWSLLLANQLFSTGNRREKKTKKRGRSRKFRRSRFRKRRSGRN